MYQQSLWLWNVKVRSVGEGDVCEGTPVTDLEKLTLRVISCLNLQRYILLNTKCSLSKIKEA